MNKFFEQIFGYNIGVACISKVIGVDPDIFGSEVKLCGGDGSKFPVCVRSELGLFVGFRGGSDDFVSELIDGSGIALLRIARFSSLLVYLLYLFILHAWR